ncbi:MAG: hypothetical protein J1F39_04385 [Clostridiales bacterium]|nr:hypothetical protein [Clostridiales bacterium]
MSRISQIKKEMEDIELEIKAYELKRERSQTALIRCLLSGKKANPEDEQYFNLFSDLIDKDRDALRRLGAELEQLQKEKKNKKKK